MTEEHRERDGDDATRARMAEIVPAFALGEDAYRTVTDADDEVFLLYTLSAPPPDRRGLGQLDSVRDSLTLSIDLSDPHSKPIVEAAEDSASVRRVLRRKGKTESHDVQGTQNGKQDLLRITLRQDSTSLRSNAGDTGSVVWRSSAYLAAKMLHDLSEETLRNAQPDQRPTEKSTSILSWQYLTRASKTTIVELGAGTGVLPCMCLSHPHLAASPGSSPRWIATDQASIVPLLRKNTTLCAPQARAAALDWQEAAQVYSQGTASARRAFDRDLFSDANDDDNDNDTESSAMADIVIATDCVYNPHLLPALLDTMSLCARPNHTVVLVVCELREVDMLRDFLRSWLEHKARWCINTIESSQVLGLHLTRGSVVWAAWRRE